MFLAEPAANWAGGNAKVWLFDIWIANKFGVVPGKRSATRDPYVDGPRATRVFSGLIGSLASICPAC